MGSLNGRNAKRIFSVSKIILPIATTYEKITFIPVFVGGRKIRDDQLGIGAFGNIQKTLCNIFHTKEVQQHSYAGNPVALVLKNDQKAYRNTSKIGRKLGQENVEVL